MKKNIKLWYRVWIDEAWRGPWLWNVVACALSFNPSNLPSKDFLEQINDSKKFSEKKREEIFSELIRLSELESPKVFFGVWVVDNFYIDEFGIKEANREAMSRALLELSRKIDFDDISWVFVDWNDNYSFSILNNRPKYIIWWDWKLKEIWAASIIAKVFRDRLISQYALLYPNLWVENNKWYWTKKHRDYLSWKDKITWIHRLSYKPIKEILEKKSKILIHACCWPDISIPILDLKDKYEVVCFWYDPNIQPKKEYNKRLKEFEKICKIEKVEYIVWEYDTKIFFEKTKGLEKYREKWRRCQICYDFRIKRTIEEAKKNWIELFTTSLIISPHKDVTKIFELSEKAWLKENLKFLKEDFRKNDWFKRSIEYTKKYNIYRQSYCGCIYSETFPKDKKNEKNL